MYKVSQSINLHRVQKRSSTQSQKSGLKNYTGWAKKPDCF